MDMFRRIFSQSNTNPKDADSAKQLPEHPRLQEVITLFQTQGITADVAYALLTAPNIIHSNLGDDGASFSEEINLAIQYLNQNKDVLSDNDWNLLRELAEDKSNRDKAAERLSAALTVKLKNPTDRIKQILGSNTAILLQNRGILHNLSEAIGLLNRPEANRDMVRILRLLDNNQSLCGTLDQLVAHSALGGQRGSTAVVNLTSLRECVSIINNATSYLTDKTYSAAILSIIQSWEV